ncbi:DegT/DnrJ/EryC1/StrS family aminotransferase [Cysteiniphilum sp. JM-1]|uniref:DegT/DnrJ/EryC1/StrS family aminotransferase n=1 Tax=Cysteiniphilum TaxID=2056696 RepID=UPI0012443AAF|nr:DegT/DnrJ/EryC1/StrS family aminotransferase [Cysteiniphilum sp. JM-1]
MENIQVFKPSYRVDETLALIRDCMEIGWTGMGYKTLEFEAQWKEYTGVSHAHFLNSATAGLHVAIALLKRKYGWEDNDEIISTPLTFVSTNHAIKYENMQPVFADVDEYLCLDPEDVRRKITGKTRAVIFVGIGGSTGQLEEIVNLCKENNLKLILDAAHMAGTRLDGVHVGLEADVTVFSFQAVKNLPTSDSGMICFLDEELDKMAREFCWLGINKDTYARSSNDGSYKWKYDVPTVGYKYHGNSIVASMGIVALKYLDHDNAYRRQVKSWYKELLVDVKDLEFVKTPEACESSTHICAIMLDNRDEVVDRLTQVGIYPGVHYIPNNQYAPYKDQDGKTPRSDTIAKRLLSLPIHLGVTRTDVERVCKELKKILRG